MPSQRDRRKRQEAETLPLDPIAVTLAIWLGVVVSITALGRLAQDAAADAVVRGPAMTQTGQLSPFIPLGS